MNEAHILVSDMPHRVNTIFCIGRNYAAHATEMNAIVEDEPIVFLKPNQALAHDGSVIALPGALGDIHYEAELVLYIKSDANNTAPADAMNHVGAYGVGLDLTARTIQTQAKAKGLPWTKAKGFAGSACVSKMLPFDASQIDLQDLHFKLLINDELRQEGHTKAMAFSCADIISYLSCIYELKAGDLIYTGTPQGVGPLFVGDQIQLQLGAIHARWDVA
jgi:2-keto-4-pentenoate hydratase/2-oxohepta-3-ene-1,7-dioic acid hydratase in catechol pathway